MGQAAIPFDLATSGLAVYPMTCPSGPYRLFPTSLTFPFEFAFCPLTIPCNRAGIPAPTNALGSRMQAELQPPDFHASIAERG